jgi:enamine deaminase RidA (YjgF/YER057c/UK114 family)
MSEEYKSPLNDQGIKCFNSAGMGTKLSSLLHISSAVVLAPNARQVVTSGQTGMREDLSYPSSLVEQFDLAFANVEASLAAAGVQGGFQAVYQMTSYHVGDLSGGEVDKAMDFVVEKYFGNNRPAWTGVGVNKLYGEAKIEITAYATLVN